MKFALISTGQFFQDKNLFEVAKRRSHVLDVINSDIIPVPFGNFFESHQAIYWRVGHPEKRSVVAKEALLRSIPFINTAYATKPLIGRKYYQISEAQKLGIPTPKTFFIKSSRNAIENASKILGFPLVVKSNISAKGEGVFLCKDNDELKATIESTNLTSFILQEFLENDGDYRVIVVGGKAVGTFKRRPKQGEFRANISLGGFGEKVENADLRMRLFNMSELICKNLDLEIAGVDFMQNKEKVYMIETNSIPQWEGFTKTTGINVASRIIDYLEEIGR